MFFEETEWYKMLKSFRSIMIFGAKADAHRTYEAVKKVPGADIVCFLVSERQDNPFWMDDKPVKVFGEIGEDVKKHALVIVSQRYENNEAMKQVLFRAGFLHVIASVLQETSSLADEMMGYRRSVLKEKKLAKDLVECSLAVSDVPKICIYAVGVSP